MADISKLTDPDAVLAAVREFDEVGKAAFLRRYGFGPSERYFLDFNGELYDSKAIVGAAFGYQFPEVGPLKASEFSGGKSTVARLLQTLGFTVVEIPANGAQRNPNWTNDEVILAMDLYVRKGICHKGHPDVIELSELLNKLPIHGALADSADFRNPSGVALKMANLASLDPDYPGKGMGSASRTDHAVWNRFSGDREELARLAILIRAGASSDDSLLFEPVDDEESVIEGRIVFRKHRSHERNQKIVRLKRRQLADSPKGICCEICDFDFERTYGERGIGYIEVHHLVPLSSLGESETTLDDLVGLCANCHRMIHRGAPWITPAQLAANISRDGL